VLVVTGGCANAGGLWTQRSIEARLSRSTDRQPHATVVRKLL